MDFEQLYKEYFSDVYKYIRKLSNNEYIAEEITSETFFKAMKSIDTFRSECDFRVWLCQIAKNSYFSYLKKQKKTDNLDDFELTNIVDPKTSSRKDNTNIVEIVQLQSLLHTLKEPYKEVFMWRVFAELNFKQIGQIFNKSDNWACVTYHRAKIMLKNRMEDINNEKEM